MYSLLEAITKLRAYPPIIIINAEASHLVSLGKDRGNNEEVSWSHEIAVPYGSWHDITEMPIILRKSFLLDVHCKIDYKLSKELEDVVEEARLKYEQENKDKDSIIHATVELSSPGFAPHYFATTRGAVPGYVKFLKSNGGLIFMEILMFFGYHSLLECIWMMMLNNQELVIKKELSHENKDDWTPMGKLCVLDYHNVPHVM